MVSAWVGGFAVTGVILAVSAYSATGRLLPGLLVLAFSLLVGVLGGTAMAAEYRRKGIDVNADRLPWSLRILGWASLIFLAASSIARARDAPVFVSAGLLLPPLAAIVYIQVWKRHQVG